MRLLVGAKQALVFAQGFFDFAVAGQETFVADADALRGFAFGHPKIADTVFADQACGFERDAAAQLVTAAFGMDAVVPGGPVHGKHPVAALGAVSQKASTKSKGDTAHETETRGAAYEAAFGEKSGQGRPFWCFWAWIAGSFSISRNDAAIRDDRKNTH
ncbi:MAG TPA: hypothetical protein VIM92_02290 [Rhodanobacteraceae bacterium]